MGKLAIFKFQTFYLASDVVCIWLLIGQSQSVIVIVKGKQVSQLMMIDRR